VDHGKMMMVVGQERLCERGSIGITDGRDL
jgi:hypothetical protein